MSGSLRKQVRAVAGAVLQGLPGFTVISAWDQTVDASALPGCAVAVPNSRHRRQDNIGTTEQAPLLLIVVKRAGDPADIEDDLDDDADLITPLIVSAIKSPEVDCELTESAVRVDRSGAKPVGTLTLQFQITTYT